MEKIILKTTVRENLRKSASKHLRKEGMIPGVIYKEGKKGVNVQIDDKDLWHALHTEAGENAIITVDISGVKKNPQRTVIVKELQLHPVNDSFVHVDFYEISMKEKLKVKVPIAVKGESAGVKEDEGVLAQIVWEVEVECLPTDIPEHIDVNVEELRIGDAIHVKDIAAPEGVTILNDPEEVMITVNPPQAEEEETEEVPVEGEEEPEVIKKGKKEEEGEGAPEEETPTEGEG
ncbi:MAG: 50S ribosomal protein L25 [Candidatus Omnitrophota bacterium]|nr:50S ribosomal protein L25 [Candidatus Omnitrophota bacterium]